MTADLCEGLSESRTRRPFSAKVRLGVNCNVEVPMAPDGRLKGGHHAEKEVDRGRQKVGDREKNGTGHERGIQLMKGRKVGLSRTREDGKAITELIRRELDSQFPVKEPRITESENGGGRQEEAEDNFVEGAGAVAQAASEKPVQEPKAMEQQHSLQDALGGWENFLSRPQLRVLLVEDDDSTRHVVGALLRNCNYEVTVAANGLIAWELLEAVNCNFDLVLTDVVMPFMSGIGLLSKMIVLEASKRIPVVMMSSYDSMDIVFRCLSKGAADFLVKPVRKNELKNLWQHVWRSCHSSSSSRSGSGKQTGNPERPNSCGGSDVNNINGNDGGGNNDGSDNRSSVLNARGGSDNGSGNQMQACMQPVQILRNNAILEAADGDEEGQGTSQQKDAISDQEMGHDLAMATRQPGSREMEKVQQQECLHRSEEDTACAMEEDGPTANGENRDGPSSSSGNASNGEVSQKAIDLINGISCQPHMVNVEQPGDSEDCDDDPDQRGSSSSKKNNSGSNSLPTLELSLKRPRSVAENDGFNDGEERRVLRHSGGSAFSRYSTGGTVIQQHHQPGGPLSINGYQLANAHGTYNVSPGQLGATSAGPLLSMGSGSSKGSAAEATTPPSLHPQTYQTRNGQDTGSSQGHDEYSHACQIKDETLMVPGMPMAISMPPSGMLAYDGVSGAYAPTMHPMYYAHPGGPTWVPAPAQRMGDSAEAYNQSAAYQEQSGLPGNVAQAGQYSHHHSHHHHNTQYHHHHHHHSHGSQPSGETPQQEEQQQSVVTPGSGAPRCGSSNMVAMADGINGQGGSSNGYGSNGNGNGSMNGSASGSNNGHSNGQTGPRTSPVDNSGNNGASGSEPGNMDGTSAGVCTEQVRFARREAALNKFRLKRKERCFEKKVRYQSRKRLAEQRPRVRGQFVRQAIYDLPSGDVE